MNQGNSGIIFSNNNRMVVENIHNNHLSVDSSVRSEPSEPDRVDIGVLTVLREETYAMVELLRTGRSYTKHELDNGRRIHEAQFPQPDGRQVRVAVVQTTDRGQESSALAFADLCRRLRPRVIALMGVAGGVNPSVEVGDVVLADSVIFYDPRREALEGVRHRGTTRTIPVWVSRAVQDFLSSRPSPQLPIWAADGQDRSFRIHYGPIGSGSAVITAAESDLRDFLLLFNEKVLAVETEAAGVAQGFHEIAADYDGLRGWLVVRGISDHADHHKGHADHLMASRHGAATLAALLGFL